MLLWSIYLLPIPKVLYVNLFTAKEPEVYRKYLTEHTYTVYDIKLYSNFNAIQHWKQSIVHVRLGLIWFGAGYMQYRHDFFVKTSKRFSEQNENSC